MTQKEIAAILEKLSKRFGIPTEDIEFMARIDAQAEYDPLPPDKWGDRFEFKLSCVFPDDDFTHLNVVPPPNACVDLLQAQAHWVGGR
jgi:hypothetical protein